MLLQRLTDYILRNRWAAIAIIFICSFLPLLGFVSIVIAILITLRKGVFAGAEALAAILVALCISYLLMPTRAEQLSYEFIIASHILTWILALVLRRYANWASVLQAGVIVSLTVIISVHGLYPQFTSQMAPQLVNWIVENSTAELTNITAHDKQVLVVLVKTYMIGAIIGAALINASSQLIVARWWQAVIFNPGGLREELHGIRLNFWLGVLLVAGTAGTYFKSAIMLDMMPLLYLVFSAAGLSLLHFLANGHKWGWVGLLVAYVLLVWLMPYSIMMLAFVALLDIVVNFRSRLRSTK